MKVLVTGSSGRLGPYVVAELQRAGHEPTLFSRRQPAAALEYLPWVQGDIRSLDDCLRALDGGFDAVQHLAAQAWPTDHPQHRTMAEEQHLSLDTTMQCNVVGLYTLLQAALREELRPVLEGLATAAGAPGFVDMIATEENALDEDAILAYMESVGHPALTMEPMI